MALHPGTLHQPFLEMLLPVEDRHEALQVLAIGGDHLTATVENLRGKDHIDVQGLVIRGLLAGPSGRCPKIGRQMHDFGMQRQIVGERREFIEPGQARARLLRTLVSDQMEQLPPKLVIGDLRDDHLERPHAEHVSQPARDGSIVRVIGMTDLPKNPAVQDQTHGGSVVAPVQLCLEKRPELLVVAGRIGLPLADESG